MNVLTAARGFSAMGNSARLEVLQQLVKAGESGFSVSALQEKLGIPASTLAHHLKFLADAELIVQEKRGREVFSRASFEHLQVLAQYILAECCSEEAIDDERHYA